MNGSLNRVDELLTKTGMLAFVPVAGERDIRDRGSVETDVCHYWRSLRRASSHSTQFGLASVDGIEPGVEFLAVSIWKRDRIRRALQAVPELADQLDSPSGRRRDAVW